MCKNLSRFAIILSILTAIIVIGCTTYSLVYGFSDLLNLFEGIEEWRDALVKDSVKEIGFSLVTIIFAFITLAKVGKEDKVVSLKNWHVILIICMAIITIYHLLNYIPFLTEDLSQYYDEFHFLFIVWGYVGVAVCVIATFAWLLSLIAAFKLNKYAQNREKEMIIQSTNVSTIATSNNDFANFQNKANEPQLTSAKVESNNELHELLGYSNKKELPANNELQNIVNENNQFTTSAEERKEKLKTQIGEDKLKYAKMKAKEYKAKLDSGEFTQSEFDVLMTALKKELLNK